jgi:biopolymer transport protein ExbB
LPLARIFLEALELDSPNIEEFRLALESGAQAEIPILKRFNTIFDTIISLSPLFGLLGTVLGLITTFGSLKLGMPRAPMPQALPLGLAKPSSLRH